MDRLQLGKTFTCEWGHTRVHCDFESSGTGQQVWAFVGTPDPKRHHGSLTQTAGAHVNYVLLGWHHGESLVVANAVGSSLAPPGLGVRCQDMREEWLVLVVCTHVQ